MRLTDTQLSFFDALLKISKDQRKEIRRQVDHLIGRLKKKIDEDTSFAVRRFLQAGSLPKGTILKPKGDYAVDADIVVELNVSEAEKADIERMHAILRKLLIAVYPQKKPEEFEEQPRTVGIRFIESGLCVDLVPVVPIAAEPGYAWQISSRGEEPVKTNVEGQLQFVRARHKQDERYRPTVRLLKAWKRFHELGLSSFTIELLVAHLLDSRGAASTLEEGLQRFFLYVAQSQLKERIAFRENGRVTSWPSDPVVVLDPVNAENNITRRLTEEERQEIVNKATEAWERIWEASEANEPGSKTKTVELWKEVFGRSFRIE